jgi:hypothetical protein
VEYLQMSADETYDSDSSPEAGSEAEPDGEGGPEGVFGNLPTTRPGARSPRRAAEAPSPSEPKPAAEAASPGPATGSTSEPAAEAPRGERPGTSSGAAPEPAGATGIEDVAWAGVAAAAEAATIGVRLATRALEAMRGAVDRR